MSDFSSKTIDLIIQAQLKNGKDLTSITKSIGELQEAIERQAAAAKKGETSIDELKSTLLSLQQVQRDLAQKADLIGQFERIGNAVQRTEERVVKTARALTDYKNKLGETGAETDKQQDRLVRLQAAYDRALKSQQQAVTTQAKLTESLREAGIETTNLGDAQSRIRTAAADIGLTIGKTNDAIRSFAEDARKAREETRALAESQRAATRDADLFAAAEKRAADAERQRAADRQRYLVDLPAQRRADAAAAGNEFNVSSETLARTRELAALRADIIARSNQMGDTKIAADAENAARQYTTLARASSDLTPKLLSVRDAIEAINNPSKAAVANVKGVEDRLTQLSQTVAAIKGPVEDYREQLSALTETQKSLSQQGGLVDNLRGQLTALRSARAEFAQARSDVRQYAAAVRQGGDGAAEFASKLASAESRLERASNALRSQVVATREARDAVRAVGLSTNDLAGAQQRLSANAQQAQGIVRQLTQAVQEYGTAAEKTSKSNGIFGDEGRTTLSLAQRIRGEILSLTASYLGLQAGIQTATDALDAYNKRAATRTVLGVGLGTIDRNQIDAEYAYVKAQSDRIGLVFSDTAAQYGKFSTAAAKAGRGRQEIRYIFESFAEGGRVLNLTQDNLNGVFLALEQIFSKGKIQAEELRQQLGERLPGVFQVAQQALAKQFPDLNKALEQGKVGAENLVLIAEAYRKMVGEQLAGATDSLGAKQARLTNAIEDFKLAVADSGFVDAYAKAIGQLTEFLQSPDGKEFAEGVSEAFTTVIEVLRAVLSNFNELSAIIKIIIAYKLGSAVRDMGVGLVALASGANAAKIAMAGLSKFLLVLTAAAAGWEFGSYIYEKFAVVQVAAAMMIAALDRGWLRLKFGAQIAFEEIPRWATNAAIAVENVFNKAIRGIGRALETFLRAIGNTKLADAVGQQVKNVVDTQYKDATDRAKQLRAELNAELAKSRVIEQEMIDYAVNGKRQGVRLAGTAGNPTPKPTPQPGKPTGPTDGEIAKRENLIQSLENALDALDARINRASSQTLAQQLKAVDLQLEATYANIEKLRKMGDAKQADAFKKRLDQLKTDLKAQVTTDFNDKILKAEEDLQTKLEQIQAQAGNKQKTNLDARLAAIDKAYADTFRKAEELIETQTKNGLDTTVTVKVKADLTDAVNTLKTLESGKFFEEQINTLVDQRQKALQAATARKNSGELGQDDFANEVNQTNEKYAAQIVAARDAAISWAQANREVFGTQEALDNFVAKMGDVSTKATSVGQEMGVIGTAIRSTLGSSFNDVIGTAVDNLGRMLTMQQGVSTSFRNMGAAAGAFLSQLAINIAKAIAQAMVLQALFTAFPELRPFFAAAGAASSGANTGSSLGKTGASVQHSGGLVGGGSSSRSRVVPSVLFANAPRYHSGGIPGLGADEYATILQKNEEVLSADSPRNILNGGAAAGGQGGGSGGTARFVLVDDRSKVAEAMSSAEGGQVIVQHIRRNAPTIRRMLGV